MLRRCEVKTCLRKFGKCRRSVALVVLLSLASAAKAEATMSQELQPAVCRIHNRLNGSSSIGSGTLIDRTSDGREGLILTCAHLFHEGVGDVVVTFADGRTHGAKLVHADYQADLAALAIANPRVEPAQISFSVTQQENLFACGYGPQGVFRCATGPPVGQAAGQGQLSLLIGDRVRSGDSGGGVFDSQGRLVAVIWGEAQGVTYASYGRPLQSFLRRVLARNATVTAGCPSGVCPLQSPRSQPRWQPQNGDSERLSLQQKVAANGKKIDSLAQGIDEAREQSNKALAAADNLLAITGEINDRLRVAESKPAAESLEGYVREEELARVEANSTQRHASLLERIGGLAQASGAGVGRAAGTAAVGLLGLSGPAGWGVLVAMTVGGWAIGRRMKRPTPEVVEAACFKAKHEQPSEASTCKEGPAADSPETFRGSEAEWQETRQPIERDDREARQLLRLSQLEGRDPLQDAVAGRLVLDRLDATAEGDMDPQRASWADELRRELRERFNEIAPTKFTV